LAKVDDMGCFPNAMVACQARLTWKSMCLIGFVSVAAFKLTTDAQTDFYLL